MLLISYPFRFLLSNIRRCFNIPSAPFLLNYSVTLRCNLNCKYCGVAGLQNNYGREELTLHDIRNFLQDKKLRGLDVIAISGGEPFLKDDLTEMLLEFKKMVSARIFHITTNGYLTDRIVDSVTFWKSRGLNIHLKVSIDDVSDRHDSLRRRVGSFKNAVATIQRLRTRFDSKKLFIGINQTIFEDNFTSIPEIKKLARGLDSAYRGFIGLKERPLYSGVQYRNYGLADFTKNAKEHIAKELADISRGLPKWTGFSNWTEEIALRHYIRGQLNLLNHRRRNRHRCMNIFTHFRLNPNGDIITCSYDLKVLGNIKNESYTSILRNEDTLERLRQVKRCAGCWLGCEVSPNLISSLFTF